MQDDLKNLEESYRLAEKLTEKYSDHPEIFFFQSKKEEPEPESKLKWLYLLGLIPFAICTICLIVWYRLEQYLWVSKTKL